MNLKVNKTPRTVFSSRNHRVVTDKEDVRERNWVKNGKVCTRRDKGDTPKPFLSM